ncbi:hypothetical protein SDC9_119181 [bioreactor metagenome]|uniref:Uncharacterized protein n=1 Tax=bioreactor metagenome TaxID=1076179 RepID=A0A645C4A5_9ZZZZ
MPRWLDPGREGIGHFIEVRQAALVIDEEALGADGACGAGGQAGFTGLAQGSHTGLHLPVIIGSVQIGEVAGIREVAAQTFYIGDVVAPVGGQAVAAQAFEGQVGLGGQGVPTGL